ncbi:ABC transporter permease [Lachnospiraceae bacterium ZAX-1]
MKKNDSLVKIAVPLVSILCAFIIGGIIIACLGKNPFEAYGMLFSGSLGSSQKIAQTLTMACPLIFTGLAAAFAYNCGVFNLGGEGQFIMGSVMSIFFSIKSGMTGPFGILISILVGCIAGGIWGAIPGLLKIWRGLNEMIVSIMLNYVATLFMGYVYTNLLREGSTPQTAAIADSLKLPRFSDDFRVHIGIIVAILLAIFLTYFLSNTSNGFKIRAVGMNPTASKVVGFPVAKLVLISFIMSGAIAGIGGAIELHGKQFRLMSGFGAGFGFDGVAIALIAQLNPGASAIVAIIFAILRKGAVTLQSGMKVPTSIVDIIQALVIIFAVAGVALIKKPFFQKLLHRNEKSPKTKGALS